LLVNQQRITLKIFLSLYAILVLLVLALLGFNEWSIRGEAIAHAEDKSRALANLASEHMLRMVEISDVALRNAVEYFALRDVEQTASIWADWHNLAQLEGSSIAGEVSQVRYMLVTGSDGRVRLDSHRFPAPLQFLKGSDFFEVQAAIANQRTAGSLFMGVPLLEESGTELYLPLSRRIGRPETGTFGGIVVAAIKPEISNRFFESLGAGRNGILVLIHEDGTILSTNPFRGDLFGHTLGNPRLLEEIRRPGEPRAPAPVRLASECCFDQQERIIRFPHRGLGRSGLLKSA
jgi:hypothetical protein